MPAKPPPTTDDGEQAVALGPAGSSAARCEVVDEAVAHGDGLLDRLHADGLVRDAGDREGARDRTGRDDDVVVLELARRRRPRA